MRGLKRWMLVAPVTLSMTVMVAADEISNARDAAAAEAVLAEAQAAVTQAGAQRALWTSAEEALRKARRALREGNAAMAVEQARIAQKHAELGIAQKSYPPFR